MLPTSYPDPLELFEFYFQEARAWAGPGHPESLDATAVALATADASGRPSVRMVLLKGVENGGFSFFTNYESRKGRELRENPHAALCFYWAKLGIQIRVEGPTVQLPASESDAYWRTRPRRSQLAAASSEQSTNLTHRSELLGRVSELENRYTGDDGAELAIPRPPHWGGYRLTPERIEFWLNQPSRMHDRLLYTKTAGGWVTSQLYP